MAGKFSDAGHGDGQVQNHVEDRIDEERDGYFGDSAVRSSDVGVRWGGSWVCRGLGVDCDGFRYDDRAGWTRRRGFWVVVRGPKSDFPLRIIGCHCQVISDCVLVCWRARVEEAFCLCSKEKEKDAVEDREGSHVEEEESFKYVR